MSVSGEWVAAAFPVILSAPSGAGKTTIAHGLRQRRDDVVFSVSATTRPPRPGEYDGVDYHFVSEARFRTMIEADELLEWAEVHGNLYGTPVENVESAARAGHVPVLDIDVQGARHISRKLPTAVSIFILPPSGDALVRRLVGRGSEENRTVRRRLDNARRELGALREFDYVVVNDDLDAAIQTVESILLAERRSVQRIREAEKRIERLRHEIVAAEALRLAHTQSGKRT